MSRIWLLLLLLPTGCLKNCESSPPAPNPWNTPTFVPSYADNLAAYFAYFEHKSGNLVFVNSGNTSSDYHVKGFSYVSIDGDTFCHNHYAKIPTLKINDIEYCVIEVEGKNVSKKLICPAHKLLHDLASSDKTIHEILFYHLNEQGQIEEVRFPTHSREQEFVPSPWTELPR